MKTHHAYGGGAQVEGMLEFECAKPGKVFKRNQRYRKQAQDVELIYAIKGE